MTTLRFATQLLAGRLNGRPVLSLVSLYPTHRCNLRCTYCNSPYLHTPEMTSDDWFAVVDEIAALGCQRVTILGGEPLLRKDVPAIAARIRARGMACVLTSNGVLVPRMIDQLQSLSTLVLSLDAAGPANDEVRGEGVFDAVRQAVAAAVAARIPVKINAVLSARTAPHLDELLAFVEQHDLHVTINVMRSGTPALWRDAQSIKAEDAEIRRTLERLASLASRNRRILFSPATYRYAALWGDYARDRFEEHELASDDPRRTCAPRCHAGREYMSIGPDGTVHPCVITFGQITGGNVRRDGVAAAWRQLHDHPCIACYSPCTVEQNHLFSLKPQVLGTFVARHLRRFA